MGSPIKPLGQRVVLELEPETAKGGIQLAQTTAIAFASIYQAIATGPGCKTVKVGDRVVINKAAATNIKVEDREITIVKEDEVLGVL